MSTLGATVLVQSSSNALRMIILTKSQANSNMGYFGSKSRSVGQIIKKPCEHNTVLVQTSSNLLRMIILSISQTSLNMGQVGSKTRSVGQIIEKHCKQDTGHIMHPIIMKICQIVCLDKITVKFEYGLCLVKT